MVSYFWYAGERKLVRSGNYVYIGEEKIHVGPNYPNLGNAVQKYRRAANREGLRVLTRFERHAYGDAVEKAIRALQKRELERCFSVAEIPIVSCASQTNHNTGKAIHKALQQQLHGYQTRLHTYSRPNPLRMVGDPADRTEKTLYAQLLNGEKAS